MLSSRKNKVTVSVNIGRQFVRTCTNGQYNNIRIVVDIIERE